MMKRMLALLLASMMCISLVACGSQAESQPENSGNAESSAQSIQQEPEEVVDVEKSTEADQSVEAEAPVAPVEDTAAFDPSWAGADYEMPIPQPPFTQFSVGGGDGVQTITATDPEEIGALTQQDVIDYCNQLKDIGFTNVHKDEPFENRYGEPHYGFAADNGEFLIELDYGAGGGSMDDAPSILIVLVAMS